MKFGLMYDDSEYMQVNAKNERSAWNQVKRAGFMNKSKKFTLKRLDVADDVPCGYSSNIVTKMVGKRKLVIPSKSSIKFKR